MNSKNYSSRILVLCTGNSCRSQMAEAFLKSFDNSLEVYSAGTEPSAEVHPLTIEVMKEIGIDLSRSKPKPVDDFLNISFDYVITVCDDANETCPNFYGKVKHRLHFPFEDPAQAKGEKAKVLGKFREVRDLIKNKFEKFYQTEIKKKD